jgi:AcrR family transcriptional regulator
VYGGRSETERRADRRARLLAAGLQCFGTEGWNATTIERLCSTAGVATRSFYVEFPSREALLLAVFQNVLERTVEEVRPQLSGLTDPAETVRTALRGYVGHLTADPRRARVVHHEVRVAGSLEQQRHAMILRFAELITRVAQLPPSTSTRVLGVALAGAVSETLVDWVEHPEPRPEPSTLVDVLTNVFLAVTRAPSPPAPAPSAG